MAGATVGREHAPPRVAEAAQRLREITAHLLGVLEGPGAGSGVGGAADTVVAQVPPEERTALSTTPADMAVQRTFLAALALARIGQWERGVDWQVDVRRNEWREGARERGWRGG